MADSDDVESQGRPRIRLDPAMSWVTRKALVMGTSGVGKTTIVNMLFNDGYSVDDCKGPGEVGNGVGACTKKVEVLLAPRQGLLICDSRGLSDPGMSDDETLLQARSIFNTLEEGPNVLIVVARFGRWTNDSRRGVALSLFDALFSSTWRKQSILVLTHYRFGGTTKEKDRELENWCKGDTELQEVVKAFAHVIMTDNCIDPGYGSITSDKRRDCLKDLKAKISSWSQPIQLGIGSWEEFFTAVFRFFWTATFGVAERRIRAFQNFEAVYSSTKGGMCAICMEETTLPSLVVTKCSHEFHRDCLLKWVDTQFVTSPTSPILCSICKAPVSGYCDSDKK